MPLMPNNATLVRMAFWSCAAVVLILALVPARMPLPSTGWDKSNHLLAFGTLAVLGLRAYPLRPAILLSGLLAFGALIEGLQSFTPDRFPEWSDLLADGVGLLLGYLLTRGIRWQAGLHRAAKSTPPR